MDNEPVSAEDVSMTRLARAGRFAFYGAFVALVIAVALASPWALSAMYGTSTNLPWDRLSEIGQALGGISAVLSALAVLGVVWTASLQVRQFRQARLQTMLETHDRLMVRALDDPQLFAVWRQDEHGDEVERQVYYINLLLNFWHAAWETGACTEEDVWDCARQLTSSDVGRGYWIKYGHKWSGLGKRGRRHRRFVAIFNEVAKQPPPPPLIRKPGPAKEPVTKPQVSRKIMFSLGLLAGAVATTIVLNRRVREREKSYSTRTSPTTLPR